MTKTVWIINQYASTPDYGYAGRHYYLGKELAKMGYNVYLVASSSHHLLRSKPEVTSRFEFEEVCERFTIVWTQMPGYAQAHSKRRVAGWFLFAWRIQALKRIIPDLPDVVYCSSLSLVSFLGAKKIARQFKARLVFEVRDIWPLTLVDVGGYSRNHPFVRFLQWVEDKAYRDSDRVVSNLKNAVEHMVRRGLRREKFAWVPNGFSMDEASLDIPLASSTMNKLPRNKFVVGYAGTVGAANALDVFARAAERLKNHPEIALVVVGDGKEKASLEKFSLDRRLNNLYFIASISKVEVPAMLSQFDVCYIGWLDDSLYDYGVGANKIPEYLYSGKPILHSYSGACDPVLEAGAGITVPARDDEKIAGAILKFYHMCPDERSAMGANGRKAALEHYEYAKLAEKLSTVLFD